MQHLRWIISALLLTVTVAGADTGFRKYAGEFMSIDVSARARAMGGAFSAVSNDVYAAFYNPAGLAQLSSMQLGVTHTQQFISSINYDYAGFAMPTASERTFGVSLIRLGVDNIKDSRAAGIFDDQGVLLGIDESAVDEFNAADYVFFFSMGQPLNSRMLIGFNAKLIRRDLGDNSANGLGFDAGLLFSVSSRLKLSAMLRNATSTLIAWDTGEKELVRPSLRVGSAWVVDVPGMNATFTPNLDLIVDGDGGPNLEDSPLQAGMLAGAVGGELGFSERLFLRGGYDELARLNFGVGFRIPHINVDYAFTGYDDELGNAHRIGLLIDFSR